MSNKTKVGIVGFGNMGRHLLDMVNMTLTNDTVLISRGKSRTDANIYVSNKIIAQEADVIFLSVKPKDVSDVCSEIKDHLGNNKIVVSVAAGISFSHFEKWLSPSQTIIRCMPNIAVSNKDGFLALAGNKNATYKQKEVINQLTYGLTRIWFDEESKIDMATAVSGCGPAYVAKIFQYYLQGAINIGISESDAYKMVLSTFRGTLTLLENLSPDDVIKLVASKGGATEQGLLTFEKSNVKSNINNAIKNSYLKTLNIKNNTTE